MILNLKNLAKKAKDTSSEFKKTKTPEPKITTKIIEEDETLETDECVGAGGNHMDEFRELVYNKANDIFDTEGY